MAVNFIRKLRSASSRVTKKEHEMKDYSDFKTNEVQLLREKLQILNL